jgi:hypothetical protein
VLEIRLALVSETRFQRSDLSRSMLFSLGRRVLLVPLQEQGGPERLRLPAGAEPAGQ